MLISRFCWMPGSHYRTIVLKHQITFFVHEVLCIQLFIQASFLFSCFLLIFIVSIPVGIWGDEGSWGKGDRHCYSCGGC